MLTSYMDVNFNKYSNVSFLSFVCTVFIPSKNHIQVLNRSSKAGAALVKTITSNNKLYLISLPRGGRPLGYFISTVEEFNLVYQETTPASS